MKLIFFFTIFFITQFCFSQPAYIKKFQPLVDSLAIVYEIPKAIIMGVSITESGMGKDRNPILLNNYFGFVGKNRLMKLKGIKTKYKQYDSPKDSFLDFCRHLANRKYYKALKGNDDYKLWIDAMAKAGYSASPQIWKKEISAVIRRYNLSEF
jgi:flagellum-specific peptidoglycan hydrolase FlgJ